MARLNKRRAAAADAGGTTMLAGGRPRGLSGYRDDGLTARSIQPPRPRRLAVLRRSEAIIPAQKSAHACPGCHDHDHSEFALAAAVRAHRDQELDLLDWTISNLFYVGLVLKAASGQPGHAAQVRTAEVLRHLDDTIRTINDHVDNAHSNGRWLAVPRRLPVIFSQRENSAQRRSHACGRTRVIHLPA